MPYPTPFFQAGLRAARLVGGAVCVLAVAACSDARPGNFFTNQGASGSSGYAGAGSSGGSSTGGQAGSGTSGGSAGIGGAPATGGSAEGGAAAVGGTGGSGGSAAAGSGGSGGTSGSAGTGGGGGSGGKAWQTACQSLVQSKCAQLQRCAPNILEANFGSVNECTQRLSLSCVSDYSAPGSSWTPSRVSDCAAAIDQASCDNGYWYRPPRACVSPAGTIASGLACLDNAQCASGYCKHQNHAACGICTIRSSSGGPCTSDADCGAGLECDVGGSNTCFPVAELGQNCKLFGTSCASDLRCLDGKCAPEATLGDSCDGTATLCNLDLGLRCDSTATNTCVAVPVSAVGQACVSGPVILPNVTLCASGATCVGGLQPITPGTCVAAPADGATCNPLLGTPCLIPAECINGTCQVPQPSMCQ